MRTFDEAFKDVIKSSKNFEKLQRNLQGFHNDAIANDQWMLFVTGQAHLLLMDMAKTVFENGKDTPDNLVVSKIAGYFDSIFITGLMTGMKMAESEPSLENASK